MLNPKIMVKARLYLLSSLYKQLTLQQVTAVKVLVRKGIASSIREKGFELQSYNIELNLYLVEASFGEPDICLEVDIILKMFQTLDIEWELAYRDLVGDLFYMPVWNIRSGNPPKVRLRAVTSEVESAHLVK